MPRFRIERCDPNAPAQPDIPGLAATIDLPELPNAITSWRQLILWFRNHPEILTTLWKAIQALIGAAQSADSEAN